jgi:outer membrane protein assembly factor BamB
MAHIAGLCAVVVLSTGLMGCGPDNETPAAGSPSPAPAPAPGQAPPADPPAPPPAPTPAPNPAATLGIQSQPRSTFAEAGQVATFEVKVNGTGPLAYQWQRAAPGSGSFAAISGEVGAKLRLGASAANHLASYRVVVSGAQGTVTSAAATLRVVGGWLGEKIVSANTASERRPRSLAVDETGHMAVVGQAGTGSLTLGLVVKVTPTGTAAWPQARAFGGTGLTYFSEVAFAANGDLYVVGATESAAVAGRAIAGATDAVLLKLAADTGNVIWARSLRSPMGDSAEAVCVDAQGNVYVAGYAADQLEDTADAFGGWFDAFLAKYSPSGQLLWLRQLGGEGDQAFVDEQSGHAWRAVKGPAIHLTLDAQGKPLVALSAQTGAVANNHDLHIVRFEPDGSSGTVIASADLRRNDRVHRVAVSVDGDIVIAGTSESTTVQDPFVLRLDSTGHEVSRVLLPLDPGLQLVHGIAAGLALDGEGNAVLVAHADSFDQSYRRVVWAKVDRSGHLAWARMRQGPIEAGGAVVDAAGRVFVALVNNGVSVLRLRPQDGGIYP